MALPWVLFQECIRTLVLIAPGAVFVYNQSGTHQLAHDSPCSFTSRYSVGYEVLFTTEGAAYIQLPDSQLTLQSHHILFLEPGLKYEILPLQPQLPFHICRISIHSQHIVLNSINYDLHEIQQALSDQLVLVGEEDLTHTAHQIYCEIRNKNTNWHDAATLLLQYLVQVILRRLQSGNYLQLVDPEQENKYQVVIHKALQYCQENLSNNLSLQTVAMAVGYSPSRLSTLMTLHGLSFAKRLRQMRMQVACLLLLQSDLPIAEIAAHVGYVNPWHFTRAFTRVIGISPRLYRKSNLH